MFVFTYKKPGQWFKRSKKIKHFAFDQKLDRMILTFPSGKLQEIAEWSKCDCWLGDDWFEADLEMKKKLALAKTSV